MRRRDRSPRPLVRKTVGRLLPMSLALVALFVAGASFSASAGREAGALSGAATIWLHRSLPDPTPPAKRLSLDFAVQLALEARSAQVSWSLMLAVLRVEGQTGPAPASSGELRALARRLAELGAGLNATDAVGALTGSASFAEKAVALAHYNRAA